MSYSSEVLADTPMAYWKLDEASGAFADTTGNTTAAAVFGAAFNYQQPPLITENFSISNTSTSLGSTATDIQFSNANVWTVEAWIKIALADIVTLAGIIEMGFSAPLLRVQPTTGLLRLVKSHVADDGDSTISVADNVLHHVVGRRTGGVSTLFIDGVDRTGTMTNPTYANVAGNRKGFGASWVGPASGPSNPNAPDAGSYFIGNLDEIAIYDSALSDARILAHYQAGIGSLTPPQVLSMQTHVFGHGVW